MIFHEKVMGKNVWKIPTDTGSENKDFLPEFFLQDDKDNFHY